MAEKGRRRVIGHSAEIEPKQNVEFQCFVTAPVIFYCRLSNKLDKDVCTGKNISRGQKIYMTSSMKNISNLVVEVGGVWGVGETQEVCTHLTIERNHPWAASNPQQSRHGRDI